MTLDPREEQQVVLTVNPLQPQDFWFSIRDEMRNTKNHSHCQWLSRYCVSYFYFHLKCLSMMQMERSHFWLWCRLLFCYSGYLYITKIHYIINLVKQQSSKHNTLFLHTCQVVRIPCSLCWVLLGPMAEGKQAKSNQCLLRHPQEVAHSLHPPLLIGRRDMTNLTAMTFRCTTVPQWNAGISCLSMVYRYTAVLQ